MVLCGGREDKDLFSGLVSVSLENLWIKPNIVTK